MFIGHTSQQQQRRYAYCLAKYHASSKHVLSIASIRPASPTAQAHCRSPFIRWALANDGCVRELFLGASPNIAPDLRHFVCNHEGGATSFMVPAANLSSCRRDLVLVASGPCLPFLHRAARTGQGFPGYRSLFHLLPSFHRS
ncbi:hypothetical protein CDEST_10721 [Colletotrichum destructivum]|uniref:Uncharacterized protein n=1 Tax=Colletotrichum destructivum TaxID=34406 RepID=A0AAX4IR61_9PEZI|nr:hypothetical protein CDEST_10721 [Colletotrichum destructivum]